MEFISENTIDTVVENFSSETKDLTEFVSEMATEQPFLTAFLSQENFKLLTDEEYTFLWYIVGVIYLSFDHINSVPVLDEDTFGNVEENHWDMFESGGNKSFREKLSPFFDQTAQEDLYAFLEDSLEEDEETPVSGVGREIIFIAASTVIGVLEKS